MKNKYSEGEKLQFLVPRAVTSGQLYVEGEFIGISHIDAPAGSLVAFDLRGIFILPKKAGEAAAIGQPAYSNKTGIVTMVPGADLTKVGVVVRAAAADESTVFVRIG